MSDEVKMDGVGVAPTVLDTIVTLAAAGVEGVAGVGPSGIVGVVQKSAKKGTRPVTVTVDESGDVSVEVHIQVTNGHRLQDVGRDVQVAVAEALNSQVGVTVRMVDVFIDELAFSG